MVMGLRIVADKLRGLPEFPSQLRTLVEHMIVSHHGKLEFGSPKLPSFPEALLLHYLDDMDSKMECMRTLIDQDRQVEGHFTGYNVSLERMVLKKAKYMSPAPAVNGRVLSPAPPAELPELANDPAPKVAPQEASHPLFAAPPVQEP
jgi:3'-5' exoribonuclease